MAAKVRRNDTVQVISGKDRGARGEVRRVVTDRGRAIVSGVNMVKKHHRARSQNETSGIVEVEAAIHLSNLMIVCSSCDKAVRIGFKLLEDGRKVRFCKSCNETID